MAEKKSVFAQNLGPSRTRVRDEIKVAMDKDSYEDFMAALKDRSITVKAILQGLKACGVDVSAGPIQKWREELEQEKLNGK